MKSKMFFLVLSCLMGLSLILASCGTKTAPTTALTTITAPTTKPAIIPTTTSTITPTTPPATTAEKPQYGGTFNTRVASDPVQFDSYSLSGTVAGQIQSCFLETIARRNLMIDPKIWNFRIKYNPPEYLTGLLAESWDQPDLSTVIIHVRKGVHYQDKQPVNGRELTAYDIEYHFHRMLGMGSGYTKPSPYVGVLTSMQNLYSITATDKYTVIFKAKQPSLELSFGILDLLHRSQGIVPREVVEKFGSMGDWRNCVGTGPFILTDYVSGNSVTLSKNSKYWDYDERYPENKLPYVDNLKYLIIPDLATALAALRTGKIDLIEDINWQQAASLKKTNPELLQITRPALGGYALGMRVDKAPFTDIRVRRAIQMAIDLKTIAETYYGGTVDATPCGMISRDMTGYFTPYNEWSAEVKAGYDYNPEGAKKLLAEAGYPSGFKTNIVTSSTSDLDLLQILKAYLAKIGIDMEIRVMDPASLSAFTQARKHDAFVGFSCSSTMTPTITIMFRVSNHSYNMYMINDPVFDELTVKIATTLDENEQKKLLREADYRAITQQWAASVLPVVNFCIYQPWFKYYGGQVEPRGSEYARFWVDQKLKKP